MLGWGCEDLIVGGFINEREYYFGNVDLFFFVDDIFNCLIYVLIKSDCGSNYVWWYLWYLLFIFFLDLDKNVMFGCNIFVNIFCF